LAQEIKEAIPHQKEIMADINLLVHIIGVVAAAVAQAELEEMQQLILQEMEELELITQLQDLL
jgi:predicted xylose isomerase-like sugar epimerase